MNDVARCINLAKNGPTHNKKRVFVSMYVLAYLYLCISICIYTFVYLYVCVVAGFTWQGLTLDNKRAPSPTEGLPAPLFILS